MYFHKGPTHLGLLKFLNSSFGDELKWYYDQKSPYLFFLHFESMYYKYLPCQILSHDFDKKSNCLNYEFLIRFPAIPQFKNGQVQKTVGLRVQSRHQNKRGHFRMQKRSARFMFYPLSCVFVYVCLRKDYAVQLLRCLIG